MDIGRRRSFTHAQKAYRFQITRSSEYHFAAIIVFWSTE